MKLSRTVTYALKATIQLAQFGDGPPIPCSRLAADGGMPERFLLQILRSLVTHGVLTSARGVDGGYTLVRRPDHISVLEVIEAIEGPLAHDLPLGEGMPRESRKRLTLALQGVSEQMRRDLHAIKLSQLVPTRSSQLQEAS
jgi:Rrf2 family protein